MLAHVVVSIVVKVGNVVYMISDSLITMFEVHCAVVEHLAPSS